MQKHTIVYMQDNDIRTKQVTAANAQQAATAIDTRSAHVLCAFETRATDDIQRVAQYLLALAARK